MMLYDWNSENKDKYKWQDRIHNYIQWEQADYRYKRTKIKKKVYLMIVLCM